MEQWPKECFERDEQNRKDFETVFVIMTTNTFSNYMADSDYLIASLCEFSFSVFFFWFS
jgi:hypothetical protein